MSQNNIIEKKWDDFKQSLTLLWIIQKSQQWNNATLNKNEHCDIQEACKKATEKVSNKT